MEDSIEIAFQNDTPFFSLQNDTSSVEYIVDTELEDNLRDFQAENKDEIDTIFNTLDDNEDQEEDNRSNSNDESEFVNDEDMSPKEEFHNVDSE